MSNMMTDLKKYLQYSPSENQKEENDNKKFHLINELNYKKIITFILIIILYF